jgi:hypothetical protein
MVSKCEVQFKVELFTCTNYLLKLHFKECFWCMCFFFPPVLDLRDYKINHSFSAPLPGTLRREDVRAVYGVRSGLNVLWCWSCRSLFSFVLAEGWWVKLLHVLFPPVSSFCEDPTVAMLFCGRLNIVHQWNLRWGSRWDPASDGGILTSVAFWDVITLCK